MYSGGAVAMSAIGAGRASADSCCCCSSSIPSRASQPAIGSVAGAAQGTLWFVCLIILRDFVVRVSDYPNCLLQGFLRRADVHVSQVLVSAEI